MSKKKKMPEQAAPARKRPNLPTKAQQEVLKQHNLSVITWEAIQDMPNSLILRHRITGDMKVVEKHGPVHS